MLNLRKSILSLCLALLLWPGARTAAELEIPPPAPAALEAETLSEPTIVLTDPQLIAECKKAFPHPLLDQLKDRRLNETLGSTSCLYTEEWLQHAAYRYSNTPTSCPERNGSTLFKAYREEWRKLCQTGEIRDLPMLYRAAKHIYRSNFLVLFYDINELKQGSRFKSPEDVAHLVTPGFFDNTTKAWQGNESFDVNDEVFYKLSLLTKDEDAKKFFFLAMEEQKGLGAPWSVGGQATCFNVTKFNWKEGYLRYAKSPHKDSWKDSGNTTQYTGSLYFEFFDSHQSQMLSFFHYDLDRNDQPCQCVSRKQMVQILSEVEQAMKAHPIYHVGLAQNEELDPDYLEALQGLQQTLQGTKDGTRYYHIWHLERCPQEVIQSWERPLITP